MQTAFLAAALLAVAIGVVHSLMGEILIFRHLRRGGLVPSLPAPPLRERNVRILWATWHLATVFGWAFAGVLLRLAAGAPAEAVADLVVAAVVAANVGGSALVLVGTRGRHPGWIALLLVAALVGWGAHVGG